MISAVELALVTNLIKRDAEFGKLPYYIFTRLIKNPIIRSRVVKTLPRQPKLTIEELDEWIELSDKDQFADYSSGKCTFAQLKKSVAERRFNIKYKVLEDMKDELHPMF